jgi:hypothetical protein
MREKTCWTAALDQRLRTLRATGLTWDQMATEMGLGRNTVLERGRRLGACGPRRSVGRIELEPHDRPARPPGHPATWALLTRGTVLDGQPYPYPVFL